MFFQPSYIFLSHCLFVVNYILKKKSLLKETQKTFQFSNALVLLIRLRQ